MTRARDLADLVGGGGSLPAATSIGDVSSTELGYLDGVTSALQTQINSRLTANGTWNSWTPTVDATTGTITSYSIPNAKYMQLGKLVVWTFVIAVPNAGTAVNAYLRATYPPSLNPIGNAAGHGFFRESSVNGKSGAVSHGATEMSLLNYDNSGVIVNGGSYVGFGFYEVA